ncbi:hypothetical protein VSX64_20370 [Aurantimonas sp. C2-6-R+9]|uniref:hypothetical protein n=1 Tax=unclassified Aurantimonas TaxID=2638230 RepID=UPI002E16D62A|nr:MULTISPECIES: hypothetical protein [unclassified Aurantimonas]MEC5293938.1 hypothetical protein [Aurantimonas sp. C2-3-R2]MEC5383183.1 hypothetical protein [Aurantimonas sp. C2-6-R+9]MEC5414989.1 hypothetical protein [Aurantimonas sp. C2-4-R8]
MAKTSSKFFQARADDAAEEVRVTSLAGAKERFEESRSAWQGLAHDARLREADAAETASLKERREQIRIQIAGERDF